MLDLTPEQQRHLESGDPVPCLLNQTECIVVRKDVFDRLKNLSYDDSDWTAEEMIIIGQRAFEDADSSEPIV